VREMEYADKKPMLTISQLNQQHPHQLFLTAREFGYKGKEIALFLQKDPSVVTRYLKDGENFKADMEHILKLLND
jgi:hypothetical protein